MRAGRLKDRVTLTAPGGLDEWGEPAAGDAITRYADVAAVKAADAVSGSAIRREATATATLRYDASIDTRYTLTCDGVTYQVVGVEANRKRGQMVLLLKVVN